MQKLYEEAQRRHAGFEKLYRSIKARDPSYLEERSRAYKQILTEIAALVMPATSAQCPSCPHLCCRLVAPELKIGLFGSIGAFGCTDFLLARCDADWPAPRMENADENLCAFFSREGGCVLPWDCRSFLCTHWFCDRLSAELDMPRVGALVDQLREVIDGFEMQRCLGAKR